MAALVAAVACAPADAARPADVARPADAARPAGEHAARLSAPFSCADDTCRQRYPRVPDDGQWDCADVDGLVVCHGGGPAAGVVAGPAEPGWTCGPRRGTPGERICVDAAPDRPAAATRGWRCGYERTPGLERVCRREAAAPRLGAPCGGPRRCANGLRCVIGRCVPRVPVPACWIDQDCAGGERCLLAACVAKEAT